MISKKKRLQLHFTMKCFIFYQSRQCHRLGILRSALVGAGPADNERWFTENRTHTHLDVFERFCR